MFTEQEARNKHCAVLNDGCKASFCMQWRWLHDQISVIEFDRQKYTEKGFIVVGSMMSGNIPMLRMVRKTDLGFCGLAGKEIE